MAEVKVYCQAVLCDGCACKIAQHIVLKNRIFVLTHLTKMLNSKLFNSVIVTVMKLAKGTPDLFLC